VNIEGKPVDASQFRHLAAPVFAAAIHEYFRETLALVESSQRFEALAHLDYPKRYWLEGQAPYREEDYEEELRAVLVAAAKRELVLEVNTTRGHILCPDISVVRWWYEAGGKGVQYGSDAHQPDKVAEGFLEATQMVESVGFKPARDPLGLWRR
jgi:histidinol-phosphatase (PHP family)